MEYRGRLMIVEEASGRYATDGRFGNVPQTERPSRVKDTALCPAANGQSIF